MKKWENISQDDITRSSNKTNAAENMVLQNTNNHPVKQVKLQYNFIKCFQTKKHQQPAERSDIQYSNVQQSSQEVKQTHNS